MARMTTGILGGLALTLGGCVGSLETTPYRERTGALSDALTGVTYALPKLQYRVKITRALAECPNELIEVKPKEWKQGALKFTVKVEAEPSYVPGEAYTVDYERLSGPLRKADFEMKWWPKGTLKSVGAGAEDMTADVIKDAVKTVLAIKGSTFSPAFLDGQLAARIYNVPADPNKAATVSMVRCTEEAIKKVAEVRALRRDLEKRTATLEEYKKKAEKIMARAAVDLVTVEDRHALVDLHDKMAVEEEGISAAKNGIAKAMETLGDIEEFVWDSDIGESALQQRTYAIGDGGKKKLGKLLEVGDVPAPTFSLAELEADLKRQEIAPACFEAGNVSECLGQQLNLVSIVNFPNRLDDCPPSGDRKRSNPESRECLATTAEIVDIKGRAWNVKNPRVRNARDGRADSGIFVREPVQAQLLFCRAARLKDKPLKDQDEKRRKQDDLAKPEPVLHPWKEPCTLTDDEAEIAAAFFPQLGQLRYLPLRVGPFEARKLAVSLTEEGRLESFSYNSTKAAMQAAVATAADVATQIEAAREKRETERRDDLKNLREQRANLLQDEITRLQKEAELKKLKVGNPLQPLLDETATLQAEIALYQARLARLRAEQALIEAQR